MTSVGECDLRYRRRTYLNIVCTLRIVLQSASVSSSAELLSSLFTTTTVSASTMPARTKSSRLEYELQNVVHPQALGVAGIFFLGQRDAYQSSDPNIQYTSGKYDKASRKAGSGLLSNRRTMGCREVFARK